jgi:GNAT superfamily N-acetyltransferase
MTAADIPGANRLRQLAGWNQTEKDWQRFLQLSPNGCFVACADGKVCGTVTALNYQNRFGWIGMILVDPEFRKRGIGTRLLEVGIECLKNMNVETAKLDATPMGRPLYHQRGFVEEYAIERWERPPAGIELDNAKSTVLPAITRDDLDSVCAQDEPIFGANRSGLLRQLWQENPSLGAVVHSSNEVVGYALGRSGARACYLGPWIAKDNAVAEVLLLEFLRRTRDQPVFVDICLENSRACELVKAAGFQRQRPLTRMYRGPNNHPGQPKLICGIAGPELG